MAYQHDLSGQVVLVAGASSGMGKATAIAAAEAGAQVVRLCCKKSTDLLENACCLSYELATRDQRGQTCGVPQSIRGVESGRMSPQKL